MRYTLIGELPRHLYCWVDTQHTHRTAKGFVPAIWYGLVSYPGRMWGCTVMLESGAVYRNLPAHSIAFVESPIGVWTPQDSQTWDCYGWDFTALEYDYLSGLGCRVKLPDRTIDGEYLFSVAPVGDGFSAWPEQAKEFLFIRAQDRLTIQPTNHVAFIERSFTREGSEMPAGLQRQTKVWSVETIGNQTD